MKHVASQLISQTSLAGLSAPSFLVTTRKEAKEMSGEPTPLDRSIVIMRFARELRNICPLDMIFLQTSLVPKGTSFSQHLVRGELEPGGLRNSELMQLACIGKTDESIQFSFERNKYARDVL